MARVGQSDHRQGGVRLHPQLLALRQCVGAGVSADADHRRPHRSARDILGTGEVGREAARQQDRPELIVPEDQHGRGSRRQVRPLGQAARSRRDLRLHPDGDGGGLSSPVFEMTLTAGPEHIDELGHVNNAVWVQWIQQVAVAHWDAVADPAYKDAYFWVVVRHEIDYLRPAHEGDMVTARTWIGGDRKSTRLNSSHSSISYAVFCLKKKKKE